MKRLIPIIALLLLIVSSGCKRIAAAPKANASLVEEGGVRENNDNPDNIPPPKLVLVGVNPTIDFGGKPVNSTSFVSFLVKNEGDSNATYFGQKKLVSPWRTETNCGVLEPTASCSITVYFNPKNGGAAPEENYYARFLTEWGAEMRVAVTFKGSGVTPGLLTLLSAAVVNFGVRPSGTDSYSTVSLKNTGGYPIRVNSYSLAAPFYLYSENCTQTIAPDGTCAVTVRFNGGSAGQYSPSQLVANYQNGIQDTLANLTTFQGFSKHPKIIVGAGPGGGSHVKGFNALMGNLLTNSFLAYPGFNGGVSVSGLMDTDNDGIGDILTGAEAGGGAHVKKFNHANGEIGGFNAYENFGGGVNVGGCDKSPYLITGPASGGGAAVRIWNAVNFGLVSAWDAFPGFLGGIAVACATNPATGQPLFAVAARAGATPHVKLFDISGNTLLSFHAYDVGFSGGVNVALADLNNDNQLELITSPHTGQRPVRVFNTGGGLLKEFYAFGGYGGGIFVSAGDVNADGFREIITGANAGGGSSVAAYRYSDLVPIVGFDAFPGFTGGVRVGFTD